MNAVVRRYCVGLPASTRARIEAVWSEIEEANAAEDDARGLAPSYAVSALDFIYAMRDMGRKPVTEFSSGARASVRASFLGTR